MLYNVVGVCVGGGGIFMVKLSQPLKLLHLHFYLKVSVENEDLLRSLF